MLESPLSAASEEDGRGVADAAAAAVAAGAAAIEAQVHTPGVPWPVCQTPNLRPQTLKAGRARPCTSAWLPQLPSEILRDLRAG